jgi:hypothetical protein
MDCERVAELLPWLLNGTLSAAEQELGRAHLAECERCRQELRETAFAAAIYEQHVPAEALVDYAFSRPAPALESGLIERHLSTCQECAEQLRLAQESRRLEEDEGTVVAFEPARRVAESRPAVGARTRVWPARVWQYGALAAGLAGFFAVGGWLLSWQQSRALETHLAEQQRATEERLARLEAENERLRRPETPPQLAQAREEIARLQAQVKELSSPQVNVPVLEVFPRELAQRGERLAVNQLEIPARAKVVTLILNSQSAAPAGSYSLEVLNAQQRVVWSKSGLVRHPTGDYTIQVPAESLPPGSYTFKVYGQAGGRRAPVESYQIRVSRARR